MVVIVVYVVVYAKRGVVGLQPALDPFAPANYLSAAAVLPGMLTIWVAKRLNRRLLPPA